MGPARVVPLPRDPGRPDARARMQIEEVGTRFRALLAEAGVDRAQPQPRATWTAFKRFAAEPIEGLDPAGDRDRLLFEAGLSNRAIDGSPGLYLHFQRQYTVENHGEYGGMRYALCAFGYQLDAELMRETTVQRWGQPGSESQEWIEFV